MVNYINYNGVKDKLEVVKESYVIDYTSPTFQTLVMEEEGGFNYKWVYGLERLSVKITSEGTNWWGQNVTTDILKDYTHQDRLGSTTNLSDQFGRVVGRADYNEWGEVTFKESLSISSSYRRIYPQLSYTGYDWDDVLGMYYAKARFYDADAKRFVAIDPIKGSIVDPLSLVSYLYCVDNPLRWVDPLGLNPSDLRPEASVIAIDGGAGGAAGVAVGIVVGVAVLTEGLFNSQLLPDAQAAFQEMMDDLSSVAQDLLVGSVVSYPTYAEVFTPGSYVQQLLDTYLDDASTPEIRTQREAQFNSMMEVLELQLISFDLTASDPELQAYYEPFCCRIREAVKEATRNPSSEEWCIYILVEKEGQLSSVFYVGMTNDASRRYKEHLRTKGEKYGNFFMSIVEDKISDSLTARVKEQLYMAALFSMMKENIILANQRRSISSTKLNDRKSKEQQAILQIFSDWAEDLVLSALDAVHFPY